MAWPRGGVLRPAGWGRAVASRPCASGGSRGGRGPWRPGARSGRPLASAPGALPLRAQCGGARCPGPRAEGGNGAVESRARLAEGRPPLLQPPAVVFFGKLRFFLSLSGLRQKGADESSRRAGSTLRGALQGAFGWAP